MDSINSATQNRVRRLQPQFHSMAGDHKSNCSEHFSAQERRTDHGLMDCRLGPRSDVCTVGTRSGSCIPISDLSSYEIKHGRLEACAHVPLSISPTLLQMHLEKATTSIEIMVVRKGVTRIHFSTGAKPCILMAWGSIQPDTTKRWRILAF